MDQIFPAPPHDYTESVESSSLASRFIKGLFSGPVASLPPLAPVAFPLARSVSSNSALSSSEPIPFPQRRTTPNQSGPAAPILLTRRPTRLSQARINEDQVQSSARSISEYGSPIAGESFSALINLNLSSSIPGFPLKEMADDSRSIRSGYSSTIARPSASVAHIFRRIRGEVSLS